MHADLNSMTRVESNRGRLTKSHRRHRTLHPPTSHLILIIHSFFHCHEIFSVVLFACLSHLLVLFFFSSSTLINDIWKSSQLFSSVWSGSFQKTFSIFSSVSLVWWLIIVVSGVKQTTLARKRYELKTKMSKHIKLIFSSFFFPSLLIYFSPMPLSSTVLWLVRKPFHEFQRHDENFTIASAAAAARRNK